jgi:galactonate dehydratase
MLDAISGVDIALWDLAGKAQGVPVCRLISDSPRSEVQAYLSGVSGATREERARTVDERWSEGFRIFKLFHESTHEELLAAFDDIRTRIGSEAQVAVDALWRLTPETGPNLGRDLDARNALWLEAPLPPEDAAAHAELSRRIRTPLALGESYRTRFEMAPFFRERALRFAQPDLGRTGITEALRIAAQATQHGAAVVPHVSIALAPQIAAAVHFAAAVPDCPMLEYNPNVFSVANRYTRTSLLFRNAKYIVPDRPGLGIDIPEDDLTRDMINVTESA